MQMFLILFQHDEAKQLLTEARNLKGISFMDNTSVYMLSLDIILRNSTLYKSNMDQMEYGMYIVESIFAMRCLNVDLFLKNKCN